MIQPTLPLATALLLFAAAAAAQDGPGAPASLEGDVIVKRSQSRVPGALVRVEGRAGRFATVADRSGHYRFPAIPGAEYTLTAEHSGFQTFAKTAVVGELRVIDIELDLESLNTSVLVKAEAGDVPSGSPEISKTLTATDLGALPSNGRNVARFALLDPHVRQTQGLGSDGSAASRLSVNGHSFRHTGHMLDGISNYDFVFANAPQQTVALSSVEELKVLTNQYSVEYGGSAAGILAVSTRAGGDAFHGEAFAFLRPSGIQARPPLSTLRVPNQREQYGAAAGGPVASERTHFFATFERTGQRRGSYIQSPAPGMFTGSLDEWLALGRIDHRIDSRQSLAVRVNAQHSANDNANDRIGGFTQPSAGQLSFGQAASVQGTYRVAGARTLSDTRLAYSAYTPSATRALAPGVSIVRPSYSTEGGSSNSWVHARSAALSQSVGIQAGSHEIRTGADLQRAAAKDFSFTPFGEYRFAAGALPTADPVQYTQTFGHAMLRYGQSFVSAYVQDNWRVAPRVAANVGLRYERQSITDDRNNVAPRAGISWDVTGSGKTVLRGGAGVFHDQYYFYIARRFLLQGVESPTISVTLPYGAAGFPSFPSSLASVPAGAAAAKRDLYLRPASVLNPYSLEYSLGLRQDLGNEWVFTADVMHSHTLKQMRARDINAPSRFDRSQGQRRTAAQADATRPFSTVAGVPVRSTLVIENSGSSIYDALDLSVSKRFSKAHLVQAHYVYSSSSTYAMFFGEPNTGVPDDWSDTGRAERGPSDFYQRHRVVARSAHDLPWGTRLLLTCNAGSGLPVNPLTGSDNNGDTFLSDRPAGMGRNSFRGPMQVALDFAASKRVRASEWGTVEIRMEAFNLLNRNNYLKLNNTFGDGPAPSPLFLTPIAGLQNTDPSRQLQVALRFLW